MNEATRLQSPAVPVELRPGLTVLIRYSMLSDAALEEKYGNTNPLAAIGTEDLAGEGFARRLATVIAAGLLLDEATSDPALKFDLEGFLLGKVDVVQDLERIARAVLVLRATASGAGEEPVLLNAIARAADIKAPHPPCTNCTHSMSAHDWLTDVCGEAGCTCTTYLTPKGGAPDATVEPEAPGAGVTTSPPSDTGAPAPSSGA